MSVGVSSHICYDLQLNATGDGSRQHCMFCTWYPANVHVARPWEIEMKQEDSVPLQQAAHQNLAQTYAQLKAAVLPLLAFESVHTPAEVRYQELSSKYGSQTRQVGVCRSCGKPSLLLCCKVHATAALQAASTCVVLGIC